MTAHDLLTSLGLAVLATANVSLWTLRVALAAGGRRSLAAAVSSIEAVLFALVFGSVVGSLDDPLRVLAYAVGVGVGTHLGLYVETWLRRPARPVPTRRLAAVRTPARRRRPPVPRRPGPPGPSAHRRRAAVRPRGRRAAR